MIIPTVDTICGRPCDLQYTGHFGLLLSVCVCQCVCLSDLSFQLSRALVKQAQTTRTEGQRDVNLMTSIIS